MNNHGKIEIKIEGALVDFTSCTIILTLGSCTVVIACPQAGTRLMAQGHGHSDDVAALCWSPDEKQVLSVGDDCCICVWNFYGEA